MFSRNFLSESVQQELSFKTCQHDFFFQKMFIRTFLSGVVQLNRILIGSVSFSRCSKEPVAFRECSAGLILAGCNQEDLAFGMCSALFSIRGVQQEEFLSGGLQQDVPYRQCQKTRPGKLFFRLQECSQFLSEFSWTDRAQFLSGSLRKDSSTRSFIFRRCSACSLISIQQEKAIHVHCTLYSISLCMKFFYSAHLQFLFRF